MKRLDIERQNELEPQRLDYAANKLKSLGFTLTITDKKITFLNNKSVITFFPYSGWFSGRGLVSGRGINNLIKQLKTINT